MTNAPNHFRTLTTGFAGCGDVRGIGGGRGERERSAGPLGRTGDTVGR
jgi:hypothetical protein